MFFGIRVHFLFLLQAFVLDYSVGYYGFDICFSGERCVALDDCLDSHKISIYNYNLKSKICEKNKICCPKPGNILPDYMTCGQSSPQNRVAFGAKADMNEFPWMAMLLYQNTTTWDPRFVSVCGGSLINSRYVLTAAHCVVSVKYVPKDLLLRKVRLGEHDTSSNPDWVQLANGKWMKAPRHLEIEVEEIVVHTNYNWQLENDIALLRLEMPVSYTNEIRPICVPTKHFSLKNSLLQIAGWGLTENGQYSEVLLKSTILESHKCPHEFEYFRETSQICAGGQSKTDTCTGDSGGPLMAIRGRSFDEYVYVAGITSYGNHGCGVNVNPGIYTKTGFYFKWIWENLKA